jgi:hypothetical protein
MSNPKVIITGLTHSGSTYLINVFGALGIDIINNQGMVDWTEKHGRENGPFVRLAREIARAVSADHYTPPLDMKVDSSKIFDKSIRSNIKNYIDQKSFPEIVKFPNEGWNWLIDLFDPELVVVTFRSPTGWMNSMERWNIDAFEKETVPTIVPPVDKFNAYESIFGATIGSLEHHNIDYTIVHYPRSAEDPVYLYNSILPALEVLGNESSVEDVCSAYKNIVRKEWIA